MYTKLNTERSNYNRAMNSCRWDWTGGRLRISWSCSKCTSRGNVLRAWAWDDHDAPCRRHNPFKYSTLSSLYSFLCYSYLKSGTTIFLYLRLNFILSRLLLSVWGLWILQWMTTTYHCKETTTKTTLVRRKIHGTSRVSVTLSHQCPAISFVFFCLDVSFLFILLCGHSTVHFLNQLPPGVYI